ncbi:hypothetical protein BC834DRAFT_265774, partial [Gloeopeniophorella convolvens]
MPPPPQLLRWLAQKYPKPSVDPGWLQECYAWVLDEHNLDPAADMDRITHHVELQLLQSDLTDSMAPGTGLPHNLSTLDKATLPAPPVLVQITALTEIGHSAFSLRNVRQAKLDRADLAGLARPDPDNNDGAVQDGADDEGPVPNYPRRCCASSSATAPCASPRSSTAASRSSTSRPPRSATRCVLRPRASRPAGTSSVPPARCSCAAPPSAKASPFLSRRMSCCSGTAPRTSTRTASATLCAGCSCAWSACASALCACPGVLTCAAARTPGLTMRTTRTTCAPRRRPQPHRR